MSCDNPFFLFLLMKNYQLCYIRFAFKQITQREKNICKILLLNWQGNKHIH